MVCLHWFPLSACGQLHDGSRDIWIEYTLPVVPASWKSSCGQVPASHRSRFSTKKRSDVARCQTALNALGGADRKLRGRFSSGSGGGGGVGVGCFSVVLCLFSFLRTLRTSTISTELSESALLRRCGVVLGLMVAAGACCVCFGDDAAFRGVDERVWK